MPSSFDYMKEQKEREKRNKEIIEGMKKDHTACYKCGCMSGMIYKDTQKGVTLKKIQIQENKKPVEKYICMRCFTEGKK